MTRVSRTPALLFILLALVSLVLPLSNAGEVGWISSGALTYLLIGLAIAVLALVVKGDGWPSVATIVLGNLFAVLASLQLLDAGGGGLQGLGFWAYMLALVFLTWLSMSLLSEKAARERQPLLRKLLGVVVPVIFGLWLLHVWQVIVVGFSIPQVLLPAPSQIGEVMGGAADSLQADFVQTFVRAVIPGYLIGCGSGFVVAILVDRVPFLQRGLLPLGNLVSALPIVGIAPIMVMWFGFDWQSKAAVVVVMTFFPMLVNTLAGLNATSAIELDLMRSYAAGYGRTLFLVRLPNALPFIFNALKINSTLALIGAIVAEFFGTPIVGMGFRISTEIGRMNVDLVWASIAVAAVAGSSFYGALSLLERMLTFWHPSYRH